jgi:hypothetical protein
VETLSGKIAEVRRVPGPRSAGIHLDLESGGKVVDVHLGPAWFVEEQSPKLQKGDEVEVTGSRVQLGGAQALIARSVKKGAEVLTLRDATGTPAWSRRGRR